ncbi:ankyrin repeat domain-containing protein 6 [Schistocerca piceifrons]|uniref:ankyrin repeat domain-containing protein 6 n=1 Tax=Schistocerca piceifrons TaxID=274613 RepID=UPI001F5E9CE8|nr:ankyrin repeat domain-containing protein 6 [Schistocerca piceifrons]
MPHVFGVKKKQPSPSGEAGKPQRCRRDGGSAVAAAAVAARLRESAARGDTREALRLLDDGAPLLPDENGCNALHLAASAGHADTVAALLLAGCDVNIPDSLGCSALQRAAADGHVEVVKQLLKHGANVNHQDNVHGNTALHEASWKGYSRTVAALARCRGVNLHLKNCGGFAALHLCCQNGHNQSCRELLLAGCNPDLQNNYGDTPLHTSARYGHAGVTRILISAQCHVSDQNKNGDTALHIAAAMGRRKLTRILLEAGCDKSLKNKQNETARDIALRKDLNEILSILDNCPVSRAKSKYTKTVREKEIKNEKKREKNESGTSSKDSSTRHKDKKKHKNTHKVHFERPTGKQWSPYGCHYFPDPKAFPQPNLDSLPQEPLKKGEQYYLDLAGNIRKGPVGVGYTCYCAPFFRHMEARLDRDKQELKEHIDQAHERLDRKVSSLERRTQGRLSELTRCVEDGHALCESRHRQLEQWLARSGPGRHSERMVSARTPSPNIVTRARSLENVLDGGVERFGEPREHNRSYDALLDGNWREQSTRQSAEVLPDVDVCYDYDDRHDGNQGFETILNKRAAIYGDPLTCRSSSHATALQHIEEDRLQNISNHKRPDNIRHQKTIGNCMDRWLNKTFKTDGVVDGNRITSNDRAYKKGNDQEVSLPLQHSVPEMVARFQNSQMSHTAIQKCYSHPSERVGDSSDSSEDECEGQAATVVPNYENVCPQPDASQLARQRVGVYSPTHEASDLHNDSGYSTRLYGSSKGPSPSLSGQVESEAHVQKTTIYSSQKQLRITDRPTHHTHLGMLPKQRYEQEGEEDSNNIVTASLV